MQCRNPAPTRNRPSPDTAAPTTATSRTPARSVTPPTPTRSGCRSTSFPTPGTDPTSASSASFAARGASLPPSDLDLFLRSRDKQTPCHCRKENLRNHGLRYHPGNSEDFGLDSSTVAATKKTTPAPSAPTFSPAKEDRSVESSSIAGPSRRRRESNPDGAAADRDRHPSSDNKRRKRSGAASETSTNDNSHIVGHINEDGSIEPGE